MHNVIRSYGHQERRRGRVLGVIDSSTNVESLCGRDGCFCCACSTTPNPIPIDLFVLILGTIKSMALLLLRSATHFTHLFVKLCANTRACCKFPVSLLRAIVFVSFFCLVPEEQVFLTVRILRTAYFLFGHLAFSIAVVQVDKVERQSLPTRTLALTAFFPTPLMHMQHLIDVDQHILVTLCSADAKDWAWDHTWEVAIVQHCCIA